ncbi:MAG: S8 family serine peptidase [Fusobacteriota bacterium]
MKKVLVILLAVFMFGCLNENQEDSPKENIEEGKVTEEVTTLSGIVVGLKPEFKTNKTQDESLEELKEIINNYISNNNIKRSGGMEFKRVHSTNDIIKRYVESNPQKRALPKKTLEKVAYEEISDPLEKSLYREYKINLSSEIDLDGIIKEIKNNDNIEYVQKDNLNKLNKTTNDDYFTTNPRDTRKLWGVPATETEKAWDITEGEDIIVAVVDSGVDYNHPDLKDNIWSGIGYDFSDNDNNPMDDGRNPGHGTHVAGTIASVGNNGQGVVGVAPKAKIMAVKIFPNAYDSVCANAIRYAVDNGARVLNNSWGPTQRSSSNPTVERAIDYAHSKGAVIVFAAGNSNDNADYYSGGNYSKTISVGALDSNLRRASFSNYGSTVDIAAPGVNIISTWPNGRYNSIQGTSMAAPHVTGTAALLLSKYPNLTNEQVREALKSGATNINTDRYVGSGMLNSLNSLEGIVPEDPNPEDPFEPSPVINEVSKIEIGNQFEISGEEFGENTGEVWLLPAGQTERGYKLEIQNWSDAKVTSSVGDNIPAGDYTVIIKISTGELSNYFEVEVSDIETEVPVINEITSEIFEGDNFEISGSNFGNSGRVMAISDSKGTFDLEVESWSNTNITVINDLDSGDYNIVVQNENGNNSNEINIVVKEIEVEIPIISEIKQPLYENEDIEVRGANFGNSGKLYIWINGGAVQINTIEWSSSKVIGQKDLVKGEYYALIQNGASKEYSEWIKFEVKEQIQEETGREYLLNNHDLFDNGGVYNWSQSGSYGDDKIRGTAGDDTIRGVAGNNTIYSGLGRDTIYGGDENDTYLYIAGDGNKKIIDNGGTDKIIFFNVDQSEINYSRSGYDLLISSSKNNVDITIKYYYYNSNYKIEYIDFK